MKLTKIKSIKKTTKPIYDITVENNHNFFCNGHLIHNCDYRGEIKVILINLGDKPVSFNSGDKIAQIIFEKYHCFPFTYNDVSDTSRGENGFGSTGK
jgi:dUTPase